MGVFAFGIALGATRFAPASQEVARASGAPGVVASSSGRRMTSRSMSCSTRRWVGARTPGPTSASALRARRPGLSFSDIHAGTTVIVADQGGTMIAKSTLADGRKSGPGLCLYRAQVSVPDARFYRVGIADRPATVFSFDELTKAGWTSDVLFVASP